MKWTKEKKDEAFSLIIDRIIEVINYQLPDTKAFLS